jgi:hypothetical protein
MNKDICLVIGGISPARTARVRDAMQARVRRRRRRAGPGSRRLPSRATPVFHYLGA